MAIDNVDAFSDKELANLHANALRLVESGSARQREEADRLLPMIVAALEARSQAKAATKAAKTTKTAKKAPARKRKAPA